MRIAHKYIIKKSMSKKHMSKNTCQKFVYIYIYKNTDICVFITFISLIVNARIQSS